MKHDSRIRAFTLLELTFVIILILTLIMLAMPKYLEVVERGRSVEATLGLSRIRMAEQVCKSEKGIYTDNLSELVLDKLPVEFCEPTHYFRYLIYVQENGNKGYAIAQRCLAGGKAPQSNVPYEVAIDFDTGEVVVLGFKELGR